MRLISYEYSLEGPGEWNIQKFQLSTINLIVGDTGAGKTRILNTFFNLATHIAQKTDFIGGDWKMELEQDTVRYEYEICVSHKPNSQVDDKKRITHEKLVRLNGEKEHEIVRRTTDKLYFNGKEMPKLSSTISAISLFAEEESMEPLFQGFQLIHRRNFYSDALDTNIATAILAQDFFKGKPKDINNILFQNLALSPKLYFLEKYFPDVYDNIHDYYKDVFPFIERIKIRDLIDYDSSFLSTGNAPVFSIKEHHVDEWIPLSRLSSGMQKVLLIITDICTLSSGSIYLIDEYENSLGISAINFFPEFITGIEADIQVLLTSHHPYIINKIPLENWVVLNRRGSVVNVMYGEEVVKRYGKSKQQAFLQLMADLQSDV